MGKSKRARADEAWLRLNTPDNTGGLPGQLTIDGALADEAAHTASIVAPCALPDVPGDCPSCGAALSLAHGWAYSKDGPPSIQCPRCGVRFSVPEAAHAHYRAVVRAYYATLAPPPLVKKTAGRRARGAR